MLIKSDSHPLGIFDDMNTGFGFKNDESSENSDSELTKTLLKLSYTIWSRLMDCYISYKGFVVFVF